MKIKKVAVIGGGTMGNGIAHVFAQNNFNVYLVDVNEELLNKSIATISKNLDRQVKKEIITEEQKQNTLKNINKTVGLEKVPRRY